MRIGTTTLAALIGAAALAGCSSGDGRFNGSTAAASTAGAITSGMPASTRPVFYQQDIYFAPTSLPGGAVTAMTTAGIGTAVLVADAPLSTVHSVDNGAGTLEGQLYFDANGFTTDGSGFTYAATSNREAPGAGDLWQRDQAGWRPVLDTRDNELVATAHGGEVYAAHGSLQGWTTIQARPAGGSFAQVATIDSAVPTAIASYGGEVWIGTTGHDARGGAAKLHHGVGATFDELPLPIARVSGSVRQEISALAMISFVASGTSTQIDALAVAVSERDGNGRALSGSVLLTNGADTEVLLNLRRDAPTALAWMDGTLWVGTDSGKLLFRADDGSFQDEPALLANDGVTTLFSPQAGVLLVGVERAAAGAAVYRMIPGVGGVPTPQPQDVYYVSEVKPLMAQSCAACHNGGVPAAQSAFALTNPVDDTADHTEVLTKVDLADADASLLLLKASNDSSAGAHGGGEVFATGSAQYATIKTWIEQGARFEKVATPPPPPPPPPAPKTYSVDVGPILQADCGGCHGSSGGFSVSYNGAVARVNQTTPEASLLLNKPATNGASHGGGKIAGYGVGEAKYNVLLQWIKDGVQQ